MKFSKVLRYFKKRTNGWPWFLNLLSQHPEKDLKFVTRLVYRPRNLASKKAQLEKLSILVCRHGVVNICLYHINSIYNKLGMEDHAYNAITREAEGEPRFQGQPMNIKNLSLKKKGPS